MRCSVEKEPFHTELRLIQGAIERKSAIPTLSYFLLEAEAEQIRLTASDMELSYASTIPAQVETPGKVALPARILVDIVKSLPNTRVEIELQTLPQVVIRAGRTCFEVLALSPEDYPMPQIPGETEHTVRLPGWMLRRAMDTVDFVIPKHTLREAFLGMWLEKRGETLAAAAMDIYRLAYYQTRWEEGAPQEDFTLLIHRKALQELRNVLAADAIETVQIGTHQNLIVFDLGNRRISIRMIEDTFPEFRSFIPESAPYRVRVQRAALLESVRRIILLAKGTPLAHAPSVWLTWRDRMLELKFHNPATGTATDMVEAFVEGEPFPICVNGEFLVEFLSAVHENEIELWFKSTREPAAIRPVGEDRTETFAFVYMPIAEEQVEETERASEAAAPKEADFVDDGAMEMED